MKSEPSGLVSGCLVNHESQSIEIPDDQCSILAIDYAQARKAIELTGNRLPMRTDTACDLGMGGSRNNPRALAFAGRQAC